VSHLCSSRNSQVSC